MGNAVCGPASRTLDTATGLRADDGMMVRVAGTRYRMRDIESYGSSFVPIRQSRQHLWAARRTARAATMDITRMIPQAVFIPELNRWVLRGHLIHNDFVDGTTGEPLSPVELAGQ